MARFPRIVVPGVPHRVTQRGAQRMQVFISEDDYRAYRGLLAQRARKHHLDMWTYCIMPLQAHLIVVPSTPHGRAGLARTAIDWPNSTARAQVLGEPDPLVNCGGA